MVTPEESSRGPPKHHPQGTVNVHHQLYSLVIPEITAAKVKIHRCGAALAAALIPTELTDVMYLFSNLN